MFSLLSMEPGAGEWLEQCRAHAQLAVERDRRVPDFTVTVRGAIERKFSDVQAQLPKYEAGASDFVFELPQEEVRVIVHVDPAGPAYLKRNAVSRVSGTSHLFSRNAVDWLAISSVLCGDLRQECYHRVPAFAGSHHGAARHARADCGVEIRRGVGHRLVAMPSEALQSVADTANQGLLQFGMRRARQPSGHSKELYFWSFVVATCCSPWEPACRCTMACRSCCIRIPSSMRSQDNDRCGASCIAASLG